MALTLKLTNRVLIELHRGLNSLDGAQAEAGGVSLFEFDHKTKWNLTRNAVAVETAKAVFDKLDRAAIKRHGVYEGMPKTIENAQKLFAYTEEMAPHKEQEIEVTGLLTVKLSSLLDKPVDPDAKDKRPRANLIPQSVLKQLWPIIEADSSE